MAEKALLKAATEGNTFELQELLKKDPLLLDKLMVMPLFSETPLHVAALAGKLEFVKQLLGLAPWMAIQQSSRHGLNPLHMAAAKGNVDVVNALLDFNRELDVTVDGEGCGPLHYATFHGRSEVVRVMVSRNSSLLKHGNFKGETSLHIAVKCNKHEVIKVLEELLTQQSNQDFCDDVMMHAKDEFGNSVAKLLGSSSYKGMKLFEAYASKVDESGSVHQVDMNNHHETIINTDEVHHSNKNPLNGEEETEEPLIEEEKFLREVVLVIMVLIATVSFQALINPPQSLWRDGGLNLETLNSDLLWADRFLTFLVMNTVAFLISVWGLFAAFTRDELAMIYFWIGSSGVFVLATYCSVLLSMMEGMLIFSLFFKKFLVSISAAFVVSLVMYSRKFKKLCAKLRKLYKRFRNGRTLRRTTNNTNAMVAMTSTTSGLNTTSV